MPALARFFGDNFKPGEFKPHRATVSPAVFHLKNDVFIQQLLEQRILLKEFNEIPDAGDKKHDEDGNNVELRICPKTFPLFHCFINDVRLLSHRGGQEDKE